RNQIHAGNLLTKLKNRCSINTERRLVEHLDITIALNTLDILNYLMHHHAQLLPALTQPTMKQITGFS
ncbi:MAG: hypothetical protein WBM66_04125, partial [Thiothrix litoralis]